MGARRQPVVHLGGAQLAHRHLAQRRDQVELDDPAVVLDGLLGAGLPRHYGLQPAPGQLPDSGGAGGLVLAAGQVGLDPRQPSLGVTAGGEGSARRHPAVVGAVAGLPASR